MIYVSLNWVIVDIYLNIYIYNLALLTSLSGVSIGLKGTIFK